DREQDRRVDQHPRPQHAAHDGRAVELERERVRGGVADQAPRIAHAIHHLVAAVYARGAADALVLQALADVYAGRAHVDADLAIDAITQAERLRVGLARARAARLDAIGIVGDDQRVLVEHRALEARVRAHVLADLLAHEAGVAPGREAVEQHPEGLPGSGGQRQQRTQQFADRREIADEGDPGPQRHRDPQEMLGSLARELRGAHRRAIELHALRAVAFDPPLDPHEDLGVDRL